MRITDKSAFLENKRILSIPFKKGGYRKYYIALNLPIDTYYKLLCLIDEFNDTDDISLKVINTAEEVCAILKTADNSVTVEWVLENISIENQMDIISQVISEIDKILDNEAYKIPDIEVIEQSKPAIKGEDAKERQKKKDDIKRLTNVLKNRKTVQLMDEISIVMCKSHNSYFDVMQMPILVFKDLVRTIVINENRVDDDYNLAYLKYECEKYKIDLNSGKADEKPAQNKGADLKKLKALLG